MKHLNSLDGLRGLAVIAVVLVHVNIQFLDYGAPSLLARVFGAGWLGVDVFFVLSGFLITSILMDAAGRDPHYFQNFYARRALRIFPLYYGYVLAATVLAPLLFHFEPFASASRATVPLALYYFNFWAAITGTPAMLVYHFWSLAVEEHFYLAWPLLVRAGVRRHAVLISVCLAGIFVAPALRWWLVSRECDALARVATFCRCDGLFVGALVAVIVATFKRSWLRAERKAAWAVLAIVGPSTFALAIVQGHFYDNAATAAISPMLTLTAGISGVIITTGAAIFLLATQRDRVAVLENRWLCAVGKYSYGIYVFHIGVVFVVSHIASLLMPGWASRPEWLAKPVLSIVVFFVSYAVAAVSYRFYEKPFLRLKSRFEPPPKTPSGVRQKADASVLAAT